MRITVVEPRETGGMIHYAYHLCTALAEAGAEVTLLTGPGYELGEHPHNFTVSRTWIPPTAQRSARPTAASGAAAKITRKAQRVARLSRSTLRLFTEWRRQVAGLKSDPPDWVLFGSIEYFFEAPFLAQLRRSGIRVASIVHEPEAREGHRQTLVGRIDHRMFTHVFAQFAAMFLHNNANRDHLLRLYPGIDPRRVHVIEHGSNLLLPPGGPADVDLRARHGIPADVPVVVFFGTMLRSKGIEDLIDGFAAVHARHPDAHLLVCGHPGRAVDPDDYVRRAADLGLSDRVTIVPGYVPLEEIQPLMELASVVAFPYRSATQSGVMQVAYAFGRPVVATRVGGLPEVVEEGMSGYTVPPRDPAALGDAINRLLDDPEAARRMGDHAKHLSETKHSWSHVAATILRVFRGGGATAAGEAADQPAGHA